ncbi:MAG: PAS domain-containing sensor histidine kinase [Desulfuromonadales bacterium]|nr:PAS domain-containing sensor histidine kinase [Desulfuromonadales bacterium]
MAESAGATFGKTMLQSLLGSSKALETAKFLVLILVFLVPLAIYLVQRRRAVQALRVSRDEWQNTFDSMPDLIAILDREHRIVRANRTMREKLQLNATALIGQHCCRLIHQQDTHPDYCPHAKLLKDGASHKEEVYLPVLHGDYSISVTPLYDTAGELTGSIHIIHDITERKQVADELNRKNHEIEQMIYSVSHDLRSPLITFKTFLGYLEQDISAANNKRIGKDLEFIHSAANRMEALLNELLEMSRIGRSILPHKEITFRELATEALDAVAGQISAGRVDVRVSDADLLLCGDRRRLLQIWQNLLDNAVKYMGDQPAPLIEIGVEIQPGETVFYVCDNGIGIAPEHQEKVFGIFEQLDQHSGGVGMGLTMVRRIIELYGGHIRVESAGVGQGSCFRFTLPDACKENM